MKALKKIITMSLIVGFSALAFNAAAVDACFKCTSDTNVCIQIKCPKSI